MHVNFYIFIILIGAENTRGLVGLSQAFSGRITRTGWWNFDKSATFGVGGLVKGVNGGKSDGGDNAELILYTIASVYACVRQFALKILTTHYDG